MTSMLSHLGSFVIGPEVTLCVRDLAQMTGAIAPMKYAGRHRAPAG
jgi:hypothetical protein